MRRRKGSSSSSHSTGVKIGMDVRQVALGAVFGAAVAVNAALQSLQDAGSFLIQGPSSSKFSSPLPSVSVSRRRKLIRSAADLDRDQASGFRAFLNGEDDDNGGSFENSDSEKHHFTSFSPATDTAAGVFQEDFTDLKPSSLKACQGPKKLQVKRKNVENSLRDDGYKVQCYLRGSDEENSSTEDGDAVWGNWGSSTNFHLSRNRRGRQPVFSPLLPQMSQSEDAMSAMLQHTTNNVLETLSEAKQQREQMVEEVKRLNLPEEQSSLQLLSRFIDALTNVGDSLTIVHSALFSQK